MGCPYECSYCFLQGYQNISGIILPYNIDDNLKDEHFLGIKKNPLFDSIRIGSGEWTDSLVFDHISRFSKKIIAFFREKKEFSFEFKTKSLNIGNLLKVGGAKNIVIAWSLNSFRIQQSEEHKTPPILERLNAARQCCLAGFSVGFHFDPIVFYEGWQKDYKEIVDAVFDIVPNENIKWISLGLLRMPAGLKTTIEKRFPTSKILDGELILDEDYKLRYSRTQRAQMFKFMIDVIGTKKSRTIVYLCMEPIELWKSCNLYLPHKEMK
jgi:spore photoproduct lyase